MIGQASGLSALPFPLPSQVGSRRPTGPRADRRRAGRVSHGHREKGAHCLRKPNQGGWGHNAGDSFARNRHAFLHQVLLKEPTGLDSLPFHPKQMINKQTAVSSEHWSQDPGLTAGWMLSSLGRGSSSARWAGLSSCPGPMAHR